VAGSTGKGKGVTGEAIDAFIEVVTKAISGGGSVQLVGFGSF
jgi:DNA-binding protein HU-beta